jgi:hypothetical protein
MVSNWILDMSIGCLLLISIGLFYKVTEIFYVMFNWWMMIFLVPFAAVYSLVDRVRNTIHIYDTHDEAKILEDKYIKPVKRLNLLHSIAIAIMWLIPISVDLLFGSMAIFIAYLLNPRLNSDDVYFICLTPAILLFITYFSTRVREELTNNIHSAIYSSLGIFGIVTNTLVVEWGGYSVAKILGTVS